MIYGPRGQMVKTANSSLGETFKRSTGEKAKSQVAFSQILKYQESQHTSYECKLTKSDSEPLSVPILVLMCQSKMNVTARFSFIITISFSQELLRPIQSMVL